MWPAGLEPAPRRVSGDRSTETELRPRDGRGWTRTSSLLFVRQALSALELPARGVRDKDSNLDLRVQSAVSWPLDDPGKETFSCSCHSPTLRPWIATASLLPRVFVEAFWSPALVPHEKCAGKSSRHICSFNYRVPAGEDLSLSGGASMSCSVFFKLGITSFVVWTRLQDDEGDPLGSPSLRAAMPLHV